MGRGFGGGSFNGGFRSSGSSGRGFGTHYYRNDRYRESYDDGCSGKLVLVIFSSIFGIVFLSFIVNLSTKWREPLEHVNEAVSMDEIHRNSWSGIGFGDSLEYLYQKIGIVREYITIEGNFWSPGDPEDFYTKIEKDLYYSDENNTFYLYNWSSSRENLDNVIKYNLSNILGDLDILWIVP